MYLAKASGARCELGCKDRVRKMTDKGRQRCCGDRVASEILEDRGQVRIGQMMQTEGSSWESLRRRASDDEPGPGCHSPAVQQCRTSAAKFKSCDTAVTCQPLLSQDTLRATLASTGASESCALERLDSGNHLEGATAELQTSNSSTSRDILPEKVFIRKRKKLEASPFFLCQHISDEQCSTPLSTVPSLVVALQGGGRQGEISRMVSLPSFLLFHPPFGCFPLPSALGLLGGSIASTSMLP